MFSKILLPTDGSDLSKSAIDMAIKLAAHHKAELIALSVFDPQIYLSMAEYAPGLIEQEQKRLEQISLGYVNAVKQGAELAGISCIAKVAADTTPYAAIIRVAKAHNCDLIVMASHGRRGINALLLGSETQKVLTHTTIPVLVVR